MAVVHVTYYTDPWCPFSWAAEPRIRRLQVEFGADLRITYVMGGMKRALESPATWAVSCLTAGAESGMPVDPRRVLEDPPSSPYPAAMAVKAVSEQADPAPYLRRLRESIMVERRRLDHADALLEAAREAGGLDLDRLRIDFGSHAIVEAFGADLERAAAVDPRHHSDGAERVVLPSLEFRGADGAVHGVYGPQPYDAYRAAAFAAGAAAGEERLDVEAALRRFGALATPEVAEVCGLPGPRAPAELWRLALEWRVRPRRVLGGELWSAA